MITWGMGRMTRPAALADLHVDRVDEDHRVDRIEGPALPFRQALHHPVSNGRERLLGNLRPIDPGQVCADLAVRQPFRRQGNHQVANRPIYLAWASPWTGSVTCWACGPGSPATGKVVGLPQVRLRAFLLLPEVMRAWRDLWYSW
jgi:hypothetical protein